MKTRLDNFEMTLFVTLLALCIALAFGVGAAWFGNLPRLVIVLYGLLGWRLLVSRYRSHGRAAHTFSILILLAPLLFIPVARALIAALPIGCQRSWTRLSNMVRSAQSLLMPGCITFFIQVRLDANG